MLLRPVDARAFSALITSARGKIIFTTEEGDRLVSGSLLSTLVGLANLIAISADTEVDIYCENEEDRLMLEDFFEEA